jgi:hypothetical protein
MTEEEEYKALQAEVEKLTAYTQGGFHQGHLARLQAQSVMLLYKSNIRLAKSSERLAKRNLWLTVAVLFVGFMQLLMVGFQIWLAIISMETLPIPVGR